MAMTDTSAEAQQVLIEICRQIPAEVKLRQVFDAYQTGKILAMAGLRQRYPHASEGQIGRLWARQRLGDDVYSTVYGADSHE